MKFSYKEFNQNLCKFWWITYQLKPIFFQYFLGNGNILAARNLVLENTTPITIYVTVTDGVIWVKETLRVDLTSK